MNKGYHSIITYSAEDECLIGHIVGIKDIVSFHGTSIREIRKEFKKAVDFYLESCEKMGVEPNKPYSGHITLRIDPELHAQVALKAKSLGQSLNH